MYNYYENVKIGGSILGYAFIEALDKQVILSSEQISSLRNYIIKKYPNEGIKEQAKIFANAVHRILEKELTHFEQNAKERIKKSIVIYTVSKKSLFLTAKDLFISIIHLEIDSNKYKDQIIHWLIDRLENINPNTIRNSFERYLESIGHKWANNKVEIINYSSTKKYKYNYKKIALAFVFAIALIYYMVLQIPKVTTENLSIYDSSLIDRLLVPNMYDSAKEIDYVDINLEKLKEFLNKKNSILVQDDNLETIIEITKEFNINPLLLIAIIGQEQNFVPKDHPYANSIINNPYNVFYSWEKYNTNLKDTTTIASRTLKRLSKDKPEEISIIKWINREYAQDQNWYIGVEKFLKILETEVGYLK
jgi:hypothetical protein